MNLFKTTVKSAFMLIVIFLLVGFQNQPACCQPSHLVDPSHNYPNQQQSDQPEPKEEPRGATVKEVPERETPPHDRQDEQERHKEQAERERQKEKVEEEIQRRREQEHRFREERDRKAAEKRERIQHIRERNQKRIEQQLFKTDLVAANLEVLPAAVVQHQTIKLVAFVHNRSEKKTHDVPVHFYLGLTPIGEKVLHMKADETREVSFDVPMATPGTHEVTVKVDPNNKIAEKTKRNNTQTRMVDVAPAPPEEEQSVHGNQHAKTKQQLPQPTFSASKKKEKTDPVPKLLGTIRKQPAKPEPPDQSIFMDKGKIVDLRVYIHHTNGTVTGNGESVTVTVMNTGKLPAKNPFVVGLYLHQHIKPEHKHKDLGKIVINGLAEKKSKTVTIKWKKSTWGSQSPPHDPPQSGTNYVAIVDSHFNVNEGSDYGEKNNISMPFKYAIPQVKINWLSAPSMLAANIWFQLKASVVGEDYWEMYWDQWDAKGNLKSNTVVWLGSGKFPASGLNLPSTFLKIEKSQKEEDIVKKTRIRLIAKNTITGGQDEKSILVYRATPLDGTLSIIGHKIDWDKKSRKVTGVTLTLQASTTKKFRIERYGNNEHGSLYITSAIYNRKYVYQNPQTSSKKITTYPIVSSGIYSPFPKQGSKLLTTSGKEFQPINGKVTFTVFYTPTCNDEVSGFLLIKNSQKIMNHPSLSISLVYQNIHGQQVLSKQIPIKDAFLYPAKE